MTPELLASQIARGTQAAVDRFLKDPHPDQQDLNRQIAVAYLSGVHQAAAFQVRADGDVTPQDIEKACHTLAASFGFKVSTPPCPSRLTPRSRRRGSAASCATTRRRK